MALNYSVHPAAGLEAGSRFPAVLLDVVGGQALTLNTDSGAIKGPCLVRFDPDENVKVDIKAAAADLNTANAVLRLKVGDRPAFFVPNGQTRFIKAEAI